MAARQTVDTSQATQLIGIALQHGWTIRRYLTPSSMRGSYSAAVGRYDELIDIVWTVSYPSAVLRLHDAVRTDPGGAMQRAASEGRIHRWLAAPHPQELPDADRCPGGHA